jgi:RNA polymerase sigma factor (sigma-70 family)
MLRTMSGDDSGPSSAHPERASPIFATTHWSVVLAAGQDSSPAAREALEKLCRAYWYPLYTFVRRQGQSPEDAQDVTQQFFARFLEKEYFGLADPVRGRFRSFLLAALRNFLAEQHRQAGRLKRGGGKTFVSWDASTAEERFVAEPKDEASPEQIYEKRWALTVLENVLSRLAEEMTSAGKERLFAELKHHLWGDQSGEPYAAIAARLGMTEGALKVAAHRLRQRYRELLREEVAHTVERYEEIDEELRHLIAVIRR